MPQAVGRSQNPDAVRIWRSPAASEASKCDFRSNDGAVTHLAGASGGDALVDGNVGRHLLLREHQLPLRRAVAAVLAFHAQNCIPAAMSMEFRSAQDVCSEFR